MHLLLVGAWPELANQLVGLPARVSLVQLPGAADPRETAWAHRHACVDYVGDIAATVSLAVDIDRRDPVDVVAGFREFSLPAVRAVAEKLNVACVPGPAATLGHDKAAVRDMLNRSDCRSVPFRRCATAADVAAFAAAEGFPFVLKPAGGAGSAGVHAVCRAADIVPAWQHSSAVATNGRVVAERLLDGPEFSVEVRSAAGSHEVVAVTEKTTTGPPHFVEAGHLVPARLAPDVAGALAAEAVRALRAIGHETGPSHVELIRTTRGPTIVEINRRLGGDRIWELVLLATGRDLMRESLLDAVHATPALAPERRRAAAIRFVLDEQGDEGADAASPPELLRRTVMTTHHRGPVRSSHDRLGYVLTTAADGDRAAQAAEQAARRPHAPNEGR
ncbi:ATP-grasp domain-containing protein [Mangrovihabitans endophyticus]|uniref:ATP-grasp domain-containing protein n=1 Tax=Mangrovihabitans endophyticus TaxID=1751298 RepID=A0A8J3FKX8_9ACTN|nr:ATP-grasp domain-containing protein [Mangrovihabitans endophyticus]GGK75271.1 hypothetical protein GCM10012284_06560 [Mangrovihabitans endophyticus]